MATHVSHWRLCPGDRLRKLPLPSWLLLPLPLPVAEWGTFRPLAVSHSVRPVFGCSRAGISAQPPNRVNIHEEPSRPQPAGALQNVTVRSTPERRFPHSLGSTGPMWPWPCVNRLLCRTWMWPLGTPGAGAWNAETVASQARSQAAGLILEETALLAQAGVPAAVDTITAHGSLQGRSSPPPHLPHSALSKRKVLWGSLCSPELCNHHLVLEHSTPPPPPPSNH